MPNDNTSTPLISVIIPSYNGEKYISETIQSVIDQTYKNLEIIIVDDSSTDNTVQIIASFTDPRIKFYQNETNLGIAGNTNKALSLSKGEFIMVQDHDDISSPYRAEGMLKVLLENPELTGCSSNVYDIKKSINKKELAKKTDLSEPNIMINNSGLVIRYIFDTIIFHPTIMYRSSILKSLDTPYLLGFKVISDILLFVQFLELGAKWCILENKYVGYRVHESNTSRIDPTVNYSEKLIMLKRLLKTLLPFASDEDIRKHSIIIGRREVLSYRGEANEWCLNWYLRIINYNLETNIYDHEKLLKTMARYWECFATLSNILAPYKALKLYHSIEELKPYLESNRNFNKKWRKCFIRAMKWKFIRNKVIAKK